MSDIPLPSGSQAIATSDADPPSHAATASRWGTVSGGLRSPPPAPSSGAGVRRSHTIHDARHHGKPRLEKHFEQPEDHSANGNDASSPQQSSHRANDARLPASQSSPSGHANPSLEHPSPSNASDVGDFVSSFAPMQPLYSKSAVSRNLSLPNRHSSKLASSVPHSATQGRTSAFNSLSAITGGSDLDEHDWEKLIHSSNALGDEHQQDPNASHSNLPWSSSLFSQQLSPPTNVSQLGSPMLKNDLHLDAHRRSANASVTDLIENSNLADAPSLTASASFVRRHQSLNHNTGRAASHRLSARSNDLLSRYSGDAADLTAPAYPGFADAAFSPVRHTTSLSAASSPIQPTSFSKAPWNQPAQEPIGSPSRFAGNFASQNLDTLHNRFNSGVEPSSSSLHEISHNLSNLDISGSSALAADDDAGDTITPTAANPQSHSMHPSLSASGSSDSRTRKLPQLVTNRDALQRGGQRNGAGPMSAAAYVPPIGHAHSRGQSTDPSATSGPTFETDQMPRLGPFTAAPAGNWLDKDSIAGRAGDAQSQWPQQTPSASYGAPGMDPNVVALSMALAQEQQRNAILQAQLGARSMEPGMFGMQTMDLNGAMASIGQQLRGAPFTGSPPVGGMTSLPARGQPFPTQPQFRPPMSLPPQQLEPNSMPPSVDPTSLAVSKGYNPPASTFVPPPPVARYFVIKSYTEEDVHKSLKYEIWASTDKGNARLDRAFRESASAGPIYLFFSVNASGHFCGMAQMLTPLDYATSSNVWAQDGKWKGTFKVRWIYVKDLPNNQLRHIKLTNTAECRPVTQSRDTQELTTEAGREVLRIMAEWEPRTSLLQDFGFYEMQGQGRVARVQGSPAMGLQPRHSPQPGASPALGGGAMAYPTSPELGFGTRTPNGGARRAQLPGIPQRMHGASALGLAPGTPRSNNGALPGTGAQQINHLRTDNSTDATHAAAGSDPNANANAVSAAQVAGLAPSAL